MRLLPDIALLFLFASLANAQSVCPPLQPPPIDPAKLLFTAQQEQELGEIVRQQIESRFRVIDEDQLTGYLKRIGGQVRRSNSLCPGHLGNGALANGARSCRDRRFPRLGRFQGLLSVLDDFQQTSQHDASHIWSSGIDFAIPALRLVQQPWWLVVPFGFRNQVSQLIIAQA